MLRLFLCCVSVSGVLMGCQNLMGDTGAVELSYAPSGSDDKGWELVWSDEFEGAELDATKWEKEISCWGGGNNERQCYTDRPSNVRVEDGVLKLIALPEVFSGPEFPQGWDGEEGRPDIHQDYTSGKVRTRERAAWTYGRFEARMKLPKGQGTWPAFWMLPAENVYGGWAASGEIDIMEAVNLGTACQDCEGPSGENRSSGALHFGGMWPDNSFKMKHKTLPGGEQAADNYHVFAVEWGEGQIDWFVDDEKFFTLKAKDWHSATVEKRQNVNAPFDQDFYLMLNLAVGGAMPESLNDKGFDTDSFPAELHVDWVRVYQCAGDRETGRRCMR